MDAVVSSSEFTSPVIVSLLFSLNIDYRNQVLLEENQHQIYSKSKSS